MSIIYSADAGGLTLARVSPSSINHPMRTLKNSLCAIRSTGIEGAGQTKVILRVHALSKKLLGPKRHGPEHRISASVILASHPKTLRDVH